MASGPSTIASEFKMTLSGMAMISLTAKLKAVRNTSDESEVKVWLACPECATTNVATRMSQFYIGSCGHTPADSTAGYKAGDITHRGRGTGASAVVLTTEEVEEAKGSKLEKNFLEFDVRPRSEVEANTLPSGIVYWVEVEKPGSDYAFFRDAASDPNNALVGVVNVRGTDRFMLAGVFDGGLVLSERLRPQDLWKFSAPEVTMTDAERNMAATLLTTLSAPFDPDQYASDKVAGMRALLASKVPGGATITPIASASKKPAAAPNFLGALEVAVAVAQAAKGA